MTIRVLSVASECAPLVKTGGLADVVGALPAALAPHGVEVTTLLPGYPAVLKALGRGKVVHAYDDLLGVKARVVAGAAAGLVLLVLDAPELFARDGGPYGDAAGRDWPDNARRFAALARAAADVAGGLGARPAFDLVHAHDWQAGLAPAYLRFAPHGAAPPSVMTVHNIAFQGRFPAETFPSLALPAAAWDVQGVEYFGGVGFLKAGLQAADAITTVSPTYAEEIRSPEFGMGLQGLIAARRDVVHGIVNGVDVEVWNPAADPHLPAPYAERTLGKRAANKAAVESAFGLEAAAGPLFCVVSRLTWQKGMDVLAQALDGLVAAGGRLALLGAGDHALEAAFLAAAARHPGRVGVRIGYDEALSHLLQGGADAILIPSRFEPCGLTQLYGLRYGCVPVVARTGGLEDTVIDANAAALASGAATGFQFDGVTLEALDRVLGRVLRLWARPEAWRAVQRAGMRTDVSWARSGRRYADLYADILKSRAAA
ncbi:MAG: glycogen synthase GlgA [Caulobacteraceae bacterium]|nr:glycogen synthase GlgA [Caulobacter sp.]